jgi:two-component system, LuxR family, sensor kinase FixL
MPPVSSSLSRGLVPVDVTAAGLPAALHQLAATIEAMHKVDVSVLAEGRTLETTTHVATQLYRIAQEAVTNAIKHAHAAAIQIQLRSEEAQTTLRINDDGIGIRVGDRVHEGLGLRIMQYRAQSIGAVLSVERGAANGTIVTCTLPSPPS